MESTDLSNLRKAPKATPSLIASYGKLAVVGVFLLLGLWTVWQIAAGWQKQKELTQYGVAIQARVTGHYITRGEYEDSYVTDYTYTVSDVTYHGHSFDRSTFDNCENGQVQIVYSSRNPALSLPARAFFSTDSFRIWTLWMLSSADRGLFDWIFGLGSLIAGAVLCIIGYRNMLIARGPEKQGGLFWLSGMNWNEINWYKIWAMIYFWPTAGSFEDILAEPNVKPGRAYLWVGTVAGICFILFFTLSQSFPNPGFRNLFGWNTLAWPTLALISMKGWAASLHRFAGNSNDQGKLDQLIFCSGAIMAPGSLILVIFVFTWLKLWLPPGFSLVDVPNVPILFFLIWGIYQLILWIGAVRAVERISVLKSVLIVALPGMFFLLFFGLLVAPMLILLMLSA